ncbi:MAG: hypothetical protein LBI58_05845, partial [Tannerellaceae bacterium]|nr:hypothetical protein [Tannerellaceae bacterium]
GVRSRVRDRSGNPTESGRAAGANEELQRIARPPSGGHAQNLFLFLRSLRDGFDVCDKTIKTACGRAPKPSSFSSLFTLSQEPGR